MDEIILLEQLVTLLRVGVIAWVVVGIAGFLGIIVMLGRIASILERGKDEQ